MVSHNESHWVIELIRVIYSSLISMPPCSMVHCGEGEETAYIKQRAAPLVKICYNQHNRKLYWKFFKYKERPSNVHVGFCVSHIFVGSRLVPCCLTQQKSTRLTEVCAETGWIHFTLPFKIIFGVAGAEYMSIGPKSAPWTLVLRVQPKIPNIWSIPQN